MFHSVGKTPLPPAPEITVIDVFPPIPTTQFDYCAYRDGQEERGNYGWGPTPLNAITDLLEREEEENDPTSVV